MILTPRVLRPGHQALAGGRTPAALFGPTHLLRLLAKLPEMLPVSHMSDHQYSQLEARLAALAGWLEAHSARLFPEAVITA